VAARELFMLTKFFSRVRRASLRLYRCCSSRTCHIIIFRDIVQLYIIRTCDVILSLLYNIYIIIYLIVCVRLRIMIILCGYCVMCVIDRFNGSYIIYYCTKSMRLASFCRVKGYLNDVCVKSIRIFMYPICCYMTYTYNMYCI